MGHTMFIPWLEVQGANYTWSLGAMNRAPGVVRRQGRRASPGDSQRVSTVPYDDLSYGGYFRQRPILFYHHHTYFASPL